MRPKTFRVIFILDTEKALNFIAVLQMKLGKSLHIIYLIVQKLSNGLGELLS